MAEGKTSTFTIHHDRCDPSKWTITEFKALADFIRFGDMTYAAQLSRAGMQLVLSDHHEAAGGDVQHVGWAETGDLSFTAETLDDLDVGVGDIAEVRAVYHGPTQYAVAYGIGDDEGNYEGTEYETFDTEAEAQRFLDSMKAEGARTDEHQC